MVDCKELSFALGKVEPFFCSMLLVDVQARQRVSETFQFDLNTDRLIKLAPHRLVLRIPMRIRVLSYSPKCRGRGKPWMRKHVPQGLYFVLEVFHRSLPASILYFGLSTSHVAILIMPLSHISSMRRYKWAHLHEFVTSVWVYRFPITDQRERARQVYQRS